MAHKAGYVNIFGNPNAGKSTLMNALVGERISIVTSKAQTTRHRILGIVNGDDYQVIYSDTPGILKPRYKLQEGMMSFIGEALSDADVILLVVDLSDDTPMAEETFAKIRKTKAPLMILLNKCDLVSPETIAAKTEEWKKELPAAELFAVSALKGTNLEKIFGRIIALLPEHPGYFPKDQLTDRSERFFISEIVREKILLNYHQEIPYSVEVVVEEFKENETLVKIRANIFVSRETQKAILIGNKGSAIKQLGIDSRADIEKFLGKKVFLELFVKVDKDWRDTEKGLRRYGYL
ncbi:MAG TPA: GTPase Era [Bacteroidia bacterium]|nr:GTPase Era [Bacteroidia bacterium]